MASRIIAVIGNNSAMNQIRYGQIAKYGAERGNVGNLLGDMPFGKFAEMLGGYGEEVRDPAQIAPALQRGARSGAKTRQVGSGQYLGRSARVRAGHQGADNVQIGADLTRTRRAAFDRQRITVGIPAKRGRADVQREPRHQSPQAEQQQS